jgi:5'-3' exonuclease
VFVQHGYESDDIIAEISLHSIRNGDEAVIISADKDLYQCIESNVSFYNPQTGKILTIQGFKKQYGIDSMLWGMVKAIAGCTTDNVKGIKGVGEKRAIDFLLSRLNPNSKAYKAITSPEGNEISDFNQELVVLPMKGTQQFKLKRDNLSEQGWKEVTKLLGMKSIRDRMPFGRRR